MDMHDRFKMLHSQGTFVMPNPWDVGSARILESMGFEALATTSSGQAASYGLLDQELTFDQLLRHAEELVASITVPLNLDSERCFGETPEAVHANVLRMAETGAAGCSIEDYNPATNSIDPLAQSVERYTAAAEAAEQSGMVLTGRCESHLYGGDDLDETIARLNAYSAAGVHALYAPGLTDIAMITRVVDEVSRPVNVLASPRGPSVGELAAAGVRRVSTGGALARAAHGALVSAAEELLGPGTSSYVNDALSLARLSELFDR